MLITAQQYSHAVGTNVQTARRRLRHAPYTTKATGQRGGQTRLYHVVAALPTITSRERENGAVERLCALAADTHDLFVGNDAIPACKAFEEWLDEDQKQRLHEARIDFTAYLYEATSSSEIWQFVDALHCKLCLRSEICRYILTGEESAMPDHGFALSFAVANANHFDMYKETA